jgi:amino acid adenylation domain-containing protein
VLPPLASHLLLTLRYDVRVLHEGQVRAVSEYYKNVLKDMVDAPGGAHASQSFLSENERRQELPSALGDTKQSAARARGVHELFEEQAEKNPGAVAVVHEDERLTYGDLNGRANQLAHYLRGLGVGPEVPVGIYLERSAETLVCMLGVLKAGGAYVPLDAAYPPAGLASMLDESGVLVVLTRQGLSGGLPESGATLVLLDADGEQVSRQPLLNPRAVAAAENVACLYFTSGSTGPAKGVAVEHRQLLNYTDSIVARLGLTAGLSYAMVSPFHTDLGNTMIFPALATGGSLHVISQARVSDAQALARYFEQNPPDCLKIVPGHLSALLAASPGERILPLRRLVLGGESSSWELVDAVKRLRPEGCAVFNHYGPTETTVGVLAHRAELDAARDAATLPLGRPLDNARVYILDLNLHAVPLGTPGEIYVGGAGVARGYVNRPGLTAEKFIPDPFGVEPGARVYRTGDRARRLLDGNVEFLGRDDHQVKIRGFRVELQAVETALREHPSVRQAAALVGEDASGAKQLVAYVVPEGGGAFGVADLRRQLKQLLPNHMIPSSFVLLDELPLTPNGKLDRSALQGKQASAARSEDGYVAPRSAAERAIRAVWQDVLQLERVGIHDNFFDVGGHSFLMLQAQSKLQAAFGRNISIVEMLEHPTIGSLAEHLAAREEQARAFQSAERQAASRRESLLRRAGVQQQQRHAATGTPGEPAGD